MSRIGLAARRRSGQAVTEILIIFPLLLMILGGGMFIVYSSWQGIKAQQAANLAARIQGEERISGGKTEPAIEAENGSGPGVGDPDPTAAGANAAGKFNAPAGTSIPSSVYGRYYQIIKDKFFPNAKTQTYVPEPVIGQNIDKVKVVRLINLPKIPFLSWLGGRQQMKLEGDAWGGEDTYMYGLPRWGSVDGGAPQWKQQLQQDVHAQQSD